MTTPREIIDQARARHWTFRDVEFPDGAAVQFLNQRQRTLLAQYGAAIEGLIGVSVQIAVVVNGLLVGYEEATDSYVVGETVSRGFAVHLEAGTGYPYIETEDPEISLDPFGVDSSGDAFGIPLPDNFVRIIKAWLVLNDKRIYPLDVVGEPQRLERNRRPMVFVSGNRLVPAREKTQGNTDGIWDQVESIQLSYVPMQTFVAVTNIVDMPAVLVEALIASLAYTLAKGAKNISPADKRTFAEDEAKTEARLDSASEDIVEVENRVQYRG